MIDSNFSNEVDLARNYFMRFARWLLFFGKTWIFFRMAKNSLFLGWVEIIFVFWLMCFKNTSRFISCQFENGIGALIIILLAYDEQLFCGQEVV